MSTTMNALELASYRAKMERRLSRNGGFADNKYGMYLVMSLTDGWPDVDDWAGSTLREWWAEETNGTIMLETLRLSGVAVTCHPTLATCDEIRASMTFEDFTRIALNEIERKGIE